MSAARLEPVALAICETRKFELRGFLGSGAFKETYLAISAGHRPIALKILRHGHNPERTGREIDAMLRCSHPNVARLETFDHVAHEGVEYLYMLEEYLPGGTLGSRLEEGLLTRGEVISLARMLVDALAHIATLELVHRDLKPENIMFRADGTSPVIVDFGIVRDLTSSSLTHTWFMRGPGTPYFAAPEQLNNEKELIDWRTDQFSLGIVLALCVIGVHPFEDVPGDTARTVDQVAGRTGPTESFRTRAAELGLSLLERMAAPWPAHRYRKPEQLISAWEAIGADE
jgi:serine/threonine protein kinase